MANLLRLLLQAQAVTDPTNGNAYHVVEGSGMGMILSGEVSDMKFIQIAERSCFLRPEVRERHCISFYGRYRDDTIIITDCPIS